MQKILSPYEQMQQFTQDITTSHITYYFPHLKGKHQERYTDRRSIFKLTVNSNAHKIQCQQCKTSYYNALHETSFNRCKEHNKYRYLNSRMTIRLSGKDLKGKTWTTVAPYYKDGTERALCYCRSCKTFLFYLPIREGYTLTTCIDCKQIQHDKEQLLNNSILREFYIYGRLAFFTPLTTQQLPFY